jgi:hypothetical protein
LIFDLKVRIFMGKIYKFKSLLMVPDPADDSGKLSYDMESVRDHDMEFRIGDFLLSRSWLWNLFIAFMVVALVFALAYGALVIGMKTDMSFTGGGGGRIFAICFAVACLTLWLAMGIPAAIRNLKLDFVVKERGRGNWKILDEREWDRFCRMRKMEQDRRVKEEQQKEEQKLRDQLSRM